MQRNARKLGANRNPDSSSLAKVIIMIKSLKLWVLLSLLLLLGACSLMAHSEKKAEQRIGLNAEKAAEQGIGRKIGPKTASALKQDPAFSAWLKKLRSEASQQGVSTATLDQVFAEITPPVKKIIEKDRKQPEVVQTYAAYLNARVNDWKTVKGQKQLVEHSDVLSQVARRYDVQPRFIVSIWGMETNFGTYPIKEPIFNVLATLAYDNRRAAFFRSQFLDALRIVDSGFPLYKDMKSSWAGAMGQPQFMPESYLKYAVDFDNDGKKDIWGSKADVFGSIANYFKARDWQQDQTWGRKVLLPPGGEQSLLASQEKGLKPDKFCKKYKSLGVWRDLQEWQRLGVRRANGKALPARSIPAALVMADSGDNQAYIVYRNFCTIMSFNPSFKYALSIGLLSDLIKK